MYEISLASGFFFNSSKNTVRGPLENSKVIFANMELSIFISKENSSVTLLFQFLLIQTHYNYLFIHSFIHLWCCGMYGSQRTTCRSPCFPSCPFVNYQTFP